MSSSPDEDHREKNILLAKNLNQVKMDLRTKKQDLLDVRTKLRLEKQRNSRLESDQMSILQRIDFLKQKLDDTFYNNTVGYINLSKQLDQMHHDSVQCFNDTSLVSGDLNATFSTNNNAAQTTFLDKIKAISETIVASNRASVGNEVTASIVNMDTPRLSSGRQSLCFSAFTMGLSSTLATDTNDDHDDYDAAESVMNVTFLGDSSEENGTNEVATPLTESNQNRPNITMRRTKHKSRHEKASKVTKKMVRNQLLSGMENQPMATDLGKNVANADVLMLRRGNRPVKKIDYKETSLIRRKK